MAVNTGTDAVDTSTNVFDAVVDAAKASAVDISISDIRSETSPRP